MTDEEVSDKYPVPNREPWGRWVDKFSRLRPGQSMVVDGASVRGIRHAAFRLYGKGATKQKKISADSYRIWRIKGGGDG